MLLKYLPKKGSILEIASGSGEHVTYFAQHFESLIWQPSDLDPKAISSIEAWIEHLKIQHLVLLPLKLDTKMEKWPIKGLPDIVGVIAINLVHIAPWRVSHHLFMKANEILFSGGILFLYGPYKINGKHTSKSNQAFDAMLKDQDPEWGLRDIRDIIDLGRTFNFILKKKIEMPANNYSLILCKK
mgnify:CR=1 FL=1